MTVVIALAREHSVYMAADSANNVYDRPIISGARKIHRLRLLGANLDEALIAYSGDGAMAALIPERLKIDGAPDLTAPTDIHKWAHAVAFAVTELALDAGIRNEQGRMDASLLLGWHGHLWTLTHMQAIPHREGVAAIGCGEELAMGALEVLLDLDDISPLEMVTRAARVACKYDRYCHEPLQVEALTARET